MKIWNNCDLSIDTSTGINFIHCLWDYYIFPLIICVIIGSIILIIIKSRGEEKKDEKTK